MLKSTVTFYLKHPSDLWKKWGADKRFLLCFHIQASPPQKKSLYWKYLTAVTSQTSQTIVLALFSQQIWFQTIQCSSFRPLKTILRVQTEKTTLCCVICNSAVCDLWYEVTSWNCFSFKRHKPWCHQGYLDLWWKLGAWCLRHAGFIRHGWSNGKILSTWIRGTVTFKIFCCCSL